MKRAPLALFLPLVLGAAILGCAAPRAAHAQAAFTVDPCGSHNTPSGGTYQQTQDNWARLCTNSGFPDVQYQRSTSLGSALVVPVAGSATGVYVSPLGVTATTTQAGLIEVFDAGSVPPDGAVTPAFCFTVPAPQAAGQAATTSALIAPMKPNFTNGIVAVFSTGNSCFVKAGAAAFLTVFFQ